MRPVIALLATLAITGCSTGGSGLPVEDDDLSALRALEHGPLYWAGRRVAGLPLTHAESAQPGHALFVYGDCESTGGLFADGGCGPPIQIQQFPFNPAQWRIAYECHRLPPLKGLPTARHEGLVLFSDRVVLKIYARNPAEEKSVADSLRTLAGKRSLPPPPPRILATIDTACGSA